MKKTLKYMLLAVLLLMGAQAQAQTLRDGEYNYLGKISPNGTVRNARYDAIGFFNSDGTIANSKNRVVGRLTSDLQILDDDGERVGYITATGEVHDGESELLGTIERSSGKVTDAHGKVIGYAHGISMLWIASYYFFDFFD